LTQTLASDKLPAGFRNTERSNAHKTKSRVSSAPFVSPH